jgi:hypothetical protein
VGSLMPVLRELPKYKLDLVGVHEVDGRVVAPNQQENTHFCMERGLRAMNWVQVLCA